MASENFCGWNYYDSTIIILTSVPICRPARHPISLRMFLLQLVYYEILTRHLVIELSKLLPVNVIYKGDVYMAIVL